jgi:hypothetical protein
MPPVKLAIKTQPSQADRPAGNIAGVVVHGSSKKRNVSDAVVEAIGAETPF